MQSLTEAIAGLDHYPDRDTKFFFFRPGDTTLALLRQPDMPATEEVSISSLEDFYAVTEASYPPIIVPVQKVSSKFLGLQPATRVNEKSVVKEVSKNLQLLNTALNLNLFSRQAGEMIARLKGIDRMWEDYRGSFYSALKLSPLEVFHMQHQKTFLLPAILAGGTNMENQIAINGGAITSAEEGQGGANVNCVLRIEMNGPLLENEDGMLFMPPYQVFSLWSMDLDGDVLVIHLEQKYKLETVTRSFSDEEINIMIKKGSITRDRDIPAETLLFQVDGLKTSFARLTR